MENLGLTHKDLAKALGVSETTIKSYRRKFPACIVVASKGKPIRFAPEAETVCRRIQALFALGMAVEDVRTRLAEEFSWIERECPAEAMNATQQQETSSLEHDDSQSEHKKALLNEAALLKEALQQTPPPAQLAPIPAQKTLVPQSDTPSPAQSPAHPPAQSANQMSPQDSPKNEPPRTTPYTVLPPEVRTAISDMARSVVELTLQQKKLMKHVQSLEERLEKALSSGDIAPQNTGPQGLCPQTPIHEQINAPSVADITHPTTQAPSQDLTAEAHDSPDAEQKPSRGNPLLKIFGLERHG